MIVIAVDMNEFIYTGIGLFPHCFILVLPLIYFHWWFETAPCNEYQNENQQMLASNFIFIFFIPYQKYRWLTNVSQEKISPTWRHDKSLYAWFCLSFLLYTPNTAEPLPETNAPNAPFSSNNVFNFDNTGYWISKEDSNWLFIWELRSSNDRILGNLSCIFGRQFW